MSVDLSAIHRQVGTYGVRLAKALLALAAGSLLAVAAARAEDNAVERTAKKAADATERTVNRAAKATERTAKRAVGAVERGAKKTDKALTNAAEKTENWVKQKTQ